LAATLKEKLGVEALLAVGGKGQFDVLVDGEVVASKHGVGAIAKLLGAKGFPTEDEVLDAVRRKLAAR
jgi:hypothetical protein